MHTEYGRTQWGVRVRHQIVEQHPVVARKDIEPPAQHDLNHRIFPAEVITDGSEIYRGATRDLPEHDAVQPVFDE
ncbi:hypothetical protein [Burkholderia gladioli]|uniref:hypothetical protein n=1 Tax=Burkholderia gladioli TaxID=28095 RepID=UPI003B9857B1